MLNEAYRFRAAVASTTGQGVNARLFQTGSATGFPVYGLEERCLGEQSPSDMSCQSPATLTTFLPDEFVTGGVESMVRLRLRLGGVGTYWFDSISLGPAASRDNQLENASFPETTGGAQSPWKINCPSSTCIYDEVPIPVSLQEYGTYVLRLTAVAGGGLESETKEFVIVHEGC